MNISPYLKEISTNTHKSVYLLERPDIGFTACIALHSTALGPAVGGTRVANHANENEILTDALRLSRGMSLKNALAEIGAGGAKAVIWLQNRDTPREAVFSAYGEAVDSLGGRFITTEDIGTNIQDMDIVRRRTRHVASLSPHTQHTLSAASSWTALGVFCAMKAAMICAGRQLRGSVVAVQGCGDTGGALCALLAAEGASLIVSDMNNERVQAIANAYEAAVLPPDEILQADADILAPCLLGGSLNRRAIGTIKAKIIVGSANNQLTSQDDGLMLHERGIIYVPDYVANAGGLIAAVSEYRGEPDALIQERVFAIGARVDRLLREARTKDIAPFLVAEHMAQAHLEKAEQAAHAI